VFRFVLASLAWMGVCLGQAQALPQQQAKLIEEIETLASAEPPLLGIDTQIETARILIAAKRPEGRRLLDDAHGRIRSILDPHSVKALLFPAFELLFQQDPDEAVLLVSAQLAAIQSRKPTLDDAQLLDSFASVLEPRYAELAASCKAEFERIRKIDPEPKQEIDKSKPKQPNVEGLDVDACIAVARKQKEPLVKIEMFLEAMDRHEETTPGKRASLAAEILPETEKLPMGSEDRLLAQSMLTRRLFEAGDRPGAAIGAQMLEQTFVKMYDCESAACMSFKGKDPPGEWVRFFAEYLDENHITPADLGLTHRSLRVRMLLIELKKSLEEKK